MTGSVYLIGLGPVGVSLGKSLLEAGVKIVGAFDRDPQRAARASRYLGEKVETGSSLKALTEASVVIAAVSDGEILKLARRMAERKLAREHQVWLHCSGVLPAVELSPLAGLVRGIGSMHPAAVFPPDTAEVLEQGVCFAVDGDDAAIQVARDLVDVLGGVSVVVPGDKRAAYHCAMVIGSNYLITLMSTASEMLQSLGLGREDAERLISGLSSSAVSAAGAHGIDASLSGPIRRGDLTAIRGHLKELSGDPAARHLYVVLARATLEVAARDGGMEQVVVEEIRDVLGEA